VRIGIDSRALVEHRSGIGNYVYENLKQICEIDSKNEYYLYSNKKVFVDFKLPNNFKICEYPAKVGTLWLYFRLPKILKKDKIDVFWGTEHCLPKRNRYTKEIKFLLTIHDLAQEILPGVGSRYNTVIQKIFTKQSCRNADRIIVVSEATKKDIVRLYSIPEEVISVVYEGGPEVKSVAVESERIAEKFGVKKNEFLFFLSTIEPRKNLKTAILAFEEYKKKNPGSDLKFVISGKVGWKCEDVLKKMRESEFSEDIIQTGFISDEEKKFLYQNCEAFIYPSLYEGFGLPVLEAFSYEAIVITSNISSLPEVGGEAAFYLRDVYDFQELCELFEKVIKMDSKKRDEKIELGKKQCKKFSWRKSAKETLKILEELYEK